MLNTYGDGVALLDDSGEVAKRYDYDAFGNELNIDNTDTNPFRYCAEYFDAESGQIYLRNRYYQPVTGRFTQLDPIKDGVNWYAYCLNNPIFFIDPLGLSESILEIIVEKNSGSIDTIHVQVENDVVEYTSVTISGKTVYYSQEQYRYVNGYKVIDSSTLQNSFGMDLIYFQHQAEDEFDSPYLASLAWSLTFGERSIEDNKEYGSTIYAIDYGLNTKYRFTQPAIGDEDSVVPSAAPEGKRSIAVIHSHAAYNPDYLNEVYSPKDIGNVWRSKKTSYLLTPGGTLQFLMYPPVTPTIISSGMARDIKMP